MKLEVCNKTDKTRRLFEIVESQKCVKFQQQKIGKVLVDGV